MPPDSMISPAEVQGYLMIHRQDPQAALDGVSVFAAEIIENKRRGANVAKHANETDRADRVNWSTANSGDARGDYASDTDQSDERGDCERCDRGSECECAAADSETGVKAEATGAEKHKSSFGEEFGSGFLSQVLGLLRLIS
jgi:hypothetical protein